MILLEFVFYSLLFMWIYFVWIRRKYYALIFQIPGPLGLPLLGMVYKLMRAEDILSEFGKVIQKYGPVFYSWLGPFPFLVVADPQIAEDILTSPNCVNKGVIYDSIDDGIGKGLFSIKNPEWSKHRKLLNPAFNHKVLQSFMPIFNKETNQLLQTFSLYANSNSEVDIRHIIKTFSLNIALQTTMGKNIPLIDSIQKNGLLNAYECALKMMSDMCFNPLLTLKSFRQLLGREKKYSQAKNTVQKFIANLLEEELTIGDSGALHMKNEKNIFIKIAIELLRRGDFTWKNAVDESNVIVSGAFETTANTLTYTLMLLAMHPKYQQKAFEEVVTIFPKRGEFDVTNNDLQQMAYIDLILNEVMRVVTPVPLVARQSTNEVPLSNGVVLPKGVQIAIDIFHMHRSSAIWGADADMFNPERFLKTNMEDIHAFAFLPFTKGIRNCIGWRYALMSVKTTLVKLLRNYQFKTNFRYSDLCYVEDITIKLKTMPLFEIQKRDQ